VIAMMDGPSEQYPVEFLTAATLRFSGGATAQLVSSRRLPNGKNSVTLYGTKRRVEGEETLSMAPTGWLSVTNGGETTTTRIPLRDGYLTEAEDFSRAVQTGDPPAARGEDGIRSVAVTVAICEAAATGQVVRPTDSSLWAG
jgi:predicted dehydrogenase